MDISAGLLMYRPGSGGIQVLLVHPGGPFNRRKDAGVWGIPKGLVEPGEDRLAGAVREFSEETGFTATGPFVPLQPVRYKNGKLVYAWFFKGDCDPATLKSNTFELEWSKGKRSVFPEVDKAEWFDLPTARKKILAAQSPFLDELEKSSPAVK